ncbi:hypothetical protein V1477_012935, partial [Vespula maculifrons]
MPDTWKTSFVAIKSEVMFRKRDAICKNRIQRVRINFPLYVTSNYRARDNFTCVICDIDINESLEGRQRIFRAFQNLINNGNANSCLIGRLQLRIKNKQEATRQVNNKRVFFVIFKENDYCFDDSRISICFFDLNENCLLSNRYKKQIINQHQPAQKYNFY